MLFFIMMILLQLYAANYEDIDDEKKTSDDS
jgi:hypothetical protein